MKRSIGVTILFLIALQSFAQNTDRPTQPNYPGDLMVDFGFNFWTEEVEDLPTKWWGSNSFGLYYTQRIRISDYLSFYPGAGVTWEKYAFETSNTWLQNADGTIGLDTLSGVGLTKNKLTATYFDVPLEIRIHPLRTVSGEGFFIGLAAIGGVRIGSHTKTKYELNDETYKEKLYADFGLNRFRYGVQARFGFKSFHLFGKLYLNDLFDEKPVADQPNPGAFTVGATFSGF